MKCLKCDVNDRKVSSTGTVLSFCDACQKAEWRKKKSPHLNGEKRQSKPKEPKQRGRPRKASGETPHKPVQIDLQTALIVSRHELAQIRLAIKKANSLDELKKLIPVQALPDILPEVNAEPSEDMPYGAIIVIRRTNE